MVVTMDAKVEGFKAAKLKQLQATLSQYKS
jgi:hypothetical protein